MNKYLNGFNSLFSQTPTYIILYVTGRCNAKCKMCFYWKNIEKSNQDDELSLDEIDKISRSFGNLQYVTLTGGEPTLRDDLPKIARIFDKNNRVQFVSIPTNSIKVEKTKIMVEEILKTTKNPYLKLCLSLDGLGDDHDKIRGVPGCFEKVKANYKNLASLKMNVKDFEIMINMTVSSFNYMKVGEVMNYVRKYMPLAVFDFCWTRGDARILKSKEIGVDDYLNVCRTVNPVENNFSRGFSFARLIAANKLLAKQKIKNILSGEKRDFPCYAGKKMVIISEKGQVKPCEIIDTDFGNLRDFNYDIRKVLIAPKAIKVLKSIHNKQCTCTFENAIQNSLVNYPGNWLSLLKLLIFR